MDVLERQLRSCTRSWKALLGAGLTTGGLFLSISSISLVIERPKARTEPPLLFAELPPPPPEPAAQKTAPPVSSSLAEDFKFDPAALTPAPEVPLELLDIRLDPYVENGDGAIGVSLDHRFQVSKPESSDRLMIFERNQVDELPVWLYGPNPKVPGAYQRTDFDVLVFYTVNDRGRTENIYILDSTETAVNEAVHDAIRRWTFQPAKKDGKAVRIWIQQNVTYRPSSKSPFSL